MRVAFRLCALLKSDQTWDLLAGRTAWFISGKGVPMKCAFGTSVCATLILLGSLLPVSAGELDSPVKDVQIVREFNTLLNIGELERAEALARDCFLSNSSDPLAVLMMRQVLLTRKNQTTSVVFPRTSQKSRVLTLTPQSNSGDQKTAGVVMERRKLSSLFETLPNPQATGQSTGQVQFKIDFGFDKQLAQSAQASCSGGCLEPINAPQANLEQARRRLPRPTSVVQDPFAPSPLEGRVAQNIRTLPFQVSTFVHADSNHDASASQRSINHESTLTLHLIKGPISTLDRLGIVVQSETAQQISQPKLNAAWVALPKPITVPVLAPAMDGRSDRATSPFTVQNAGISDAELTIGVCSQQDKVIRHAGEPLATRHLTSEERQEILKAAQAAPRVNLTILPKLSISNQRQAELSSSVVDSMGKSMNLAINSTTTADHRAVSLQLTFQSDQGPAALSQSITFSDMLENEEALLIALDAPRTEAATDTSSHNVHQMTYLVVSPQIRKSLPEKIALTAPAPSTASRVFDTTGIGFTGSKGTRNASNERGLRKRVDLAFSTRVYSVADLVIPIPKAVDLRLNQVSPSVAPKGEKAQPDFQSLIETIKSEVEPNSWEESSGDATIMPFPVTLSLVVRQSAPIHRQIEELLGKLRHKFDIQVSVELGVISGNPESLAAAGLAITPQDMMLTRAELDSRQPTAECSECATTRQIIQADCSDACPIAGTLDFLVEKTKSLHPCLAILEQIGFEDFASECCTENAFQLTEENLPPANIAVKLLTSAQQRFLNQAVRGQKECNLLHAPKITQFNGQLLNIDFGGSLAFKMRTTVDAGQNSMSVTLSPTNETTCHATVPFTGTLKPGESLLVELPNPKSPIEGISNGESCFVLVTPRIIIAPEEAKPIKPVY